MLELLPTTGVALSAGAGTLRFGSSPDEVRVVLPSVPSVYSGVQCM